MERCIAPGGCRVVRLESYFLPRAALGLEAAGGLFAPIPLRRSGRETPDFGPKTFFVCSKSGICRGGSLPGVHTVFGGRVGRGDQSSVTPSVLEHLSSRRESRCSPPYARRGGRVVRCGFHCAWSKHLGMRAGSGWGDYGKKQSIAVAPDFPS